MTARLIARIDETGEASDVRERVDALTTRADALRYTVAADGLALAEEALALSRATGYRLGEARALRAATTYRTRQLHLDRALDEVTTAAAIFEELGESAEHAATLTAIGRVHLRRGDIAAAARFHLDALERQTRFGDRFGEATTRNSLGTVHAVAGDIAAALEQYRAAVELFEDIGDTTGESLALANVGSALGTLGQYREALEYHERALAHYETTDEAVHALLAHNNIGFAHAQLGDWRKALSHYEAALALAHRTSDSEAEISVLENIGALHFGQGDDDDALKIFHRVLAVSEAQHATVHQARARLHIGEVLAKRGRHEEALSALSQALARATASGARSLLAESHRALVSVYEDLGAPAAALRHYKAFHAVREELHGAESERRVMSVMLQAELREKDREMKFLRDQTAMLERLSREDSLTGLRNRRDLDERWPMEWERARRFKHPLTIAFADIDHFKAINDEFSHATGDRVLQTVARLILENTRKIDLVARYGGEEFALVLLETPLAGARGLCETIRLAIEEHDWASIAGGLRVTISIGIAAGEASATAKEAMACADARLYAAKRAGRNRVA